MFVEIPTEIEDSTKSMTKKFEENCLKNLCKSAKSAGNELELYFYIFITAMLIFLKKDKVAVKIICVICGKLI